MTGTLLGDQYTVLIIQGDQKVCVHLTITVQKNTQKYSILKFQSSTYRTNFFSRRLSTPNATVTLLCIPSLWNWKNMQLTKPTFSRMALRLIQRVCLWHSWTMCLWTESFLKPFGLQDLRTFLCPNFFSGVRWKTQCSRKSPRNWRVEDSHHRIHSECV